MNVSSILGQFYLNPTTICRNFQPSNIFFPLLAPHTIRNNLMVTLILPPQQNDDNRNDSEDTKSDAEDCDEETSNDTRFVEQIKNLEDERLIQKNRTKPKCIHRTRYSREEYRCESCAYTCTTEKAFLKHVRKCSGTDTLGICSKSSLSCPVCGKDKRDESSLSTHMVKHKIGKYFCCDICKFKSIQLKKIIQHRRMHTGEKPHLCPHCSYRSSRRDNLRSHVRRMHNEDDLHCDTFSPRKILLVPKC